MLRTEIDFIKDDRFRGLLSFLKEAQREFEEAETDDEIKLTRAKLNYAKELIDSHVRRARQPGNRIRDIHFKHMPNDSLLKAKKSGRIWH